MEIEKQKIVDIFSFLLYSEMKTMKKGKNMKQYKVVQNFIRKEDNSKVTYDFNYDWTISKKELNKHIKKINEDIKEVTFDNGYLVQYDEKEPYTILEREVSGFEIEGKCDFSQDHDSTILKIGNKDLIREIGKNLNGVKVKITIEVLE